MQRGFTLVLLLISLLIAIVFGTGGLLLLKSKSTISTQKTLNLKPSNTTVNQTQKIDDVKQSITIKEYNSLELSSGSLITLQSKYPTFYFNKNDYKNALDISKVLKVYSNGYIHSFTLLDCTVIQRFYDDYYAPATTDCKLEIETIKSQAPIVKNYSDFTKSFSTKENNRSALGFLGSSVNGPLLAIVVPYTQLYRDSGTQRYEFTSPIGDTVTIYTYYGFTEFKFDREDLFSKAEKTAKIGPLDVKFKIVRLDCYPPYRESDGNCSKPGDHPVYNKIDFTIDINQSTSSPEYIKILDYQL